jgi:hypothetical protein
MIESKTFVYRSSYAPLSSLPPFRFYTREKNRTIHSPLKDWLDESSLGVVSPIETAAADEYEITAFLLTIL